MILHLGQTGIPKVSSARAWPHRSGKSHREPRGRSWVGWGIVIIPASILQARWLAWISLRPQSTDPLVFYNLAGELFSEGWCWLSMRHPSNPAGCLLKRCQTTAREQKSREPCKGGQNPRSAAWQLSILWHLLPLPRLTCDPRWP